MVGQLVVLCSGWSVGGWSVGGWSVGGLVSSRGIQNFYMLVLGRSIMGNISA